MRVVHNVQNAAWYSYRLMTYDHNIQNRNEMWLLIIQAAGMKN